MKMEKRHNDRLFAEFLEKYKTQKFPDEIMHLLGKTSESKIKDIFYKKDTRLKPIDPVKLVIKAFGRPSFLIKNNTFDPSGSEIWNELLSSYTHSLCEMIQSVGIIKLKNHSKANYVGTGFLIRENTIVTNRHVAKVLFQSTSNGYRWKTNSSREDFRASIDFLQEYKSNKKLEMEIMSALYIESQSGPDIAFLEINMTDRLNLLEISKSRSDLKDNIATIGYPSQLNGVDRALKEILKTIFNDIYDVKRFSPGEITGLDTANIHHDCSTTTGNSGSAIIDIETGEVVALHYSGGIYHNSAIPAKIINQCLKKI